MSILWFVICLVALGGLAWAWTILWLVSPKFQRTAEASRRRLRRVLLSSGIFGRGTAHSPFRRRDTVYGVAQTRTTVAANSRSTAKGNGRSVGVRLATVKR